MKRTEVGLSDGRVYEIVGESGIPTGKGCMEAVAVAVVAILVTVAVVVGLTALVGGA